MTPRSVLNKELQTIDLRLRAMEEPAPSVQGDDADMRVARQGQEDLVVERARLTTVRHRIIAALIRIEEHVYGDCLTCLEPIGAKRLETLPYAELCVSCAKTEERTVGAAGQPLDMGPGDEGYA